MQEFYFTGYVGYQSKSSLLLWSKQQTALYSKMNKMLDEMVYKS